LTTNTQFRGIADINGGRGFVRVADYTRSPGDIPLAGNQIRAYALRRGDEIEGARDGNTVRIDTINGLAPDDVKHRPRFDDLIPVYPNERFRLEQGSDSPTARIIDLVAPIGKGQRGLIVAPPKAGKTTILKTIAEAIQTSDPDVHLMMMLVGERPEEVTDLQRCVRGEIAYSTFDQPADDHIRVAELAIERARRLVELGRDVVVLLDSLTRLGRAYNLAAPANGRTLTGGLAASAIQHPRHFLGAARNIEDGGSLTIVSTTLVDTGSRLDDYLFEEFKGTGNMELRLRRDLSEKRIFPAVDAVASGTRRDDLLMGDAEHAAVTKVRRAISGMEPQQALELLLERTSRSNAVFLQQVAALSTARHSGWSTPGSRATTLRGDSFSIRRSTACDHAS
jgi:transcription termination factor Rho